MKEAAKYICIKGHVAGIYMKQKLYAYDSSPSPPPLFTNAHFLFFLLIFSPCDIEGKISSLCVWQID